MNIGRKIKEHRKIRRLSQFELGEALGVSDKTVSSWEVNRTEPSIMKLKEICRALNVKLPDIIGYDEYIDFDMVNTDGGGGPIAEESPQFIIDAMGNPGLKLRLIEYAKFLLSEFGDDKTNSK